jgi:dolichol-phosphate mannosyltransferase
MPLPLVVVPTYNEAENLPLIAARLLALQPGVEVLCVDDASPDGTGDLADEIAAGDPRFHVLHRTSARGYARASIEAMRWALDREYDKVCTMDADLSHDPADVPRLVAAIDDGADVAIGSRYVEGGRMVVDWGPVRRAVSRSGSAYARRMLGTSVRDCTSGFRCHRASSLRKVALESIRSDGYSFLIEMLAMLLHGDARVVEVPIAYVDRRMGRSKISRRIIFEALGVTTGLGISRLTRRS